MSADNMRPEARVARGATYIFVQGILSAAIGAVYLIFLKIFLSEQELGLYAIFTFILTSVRTVGALALPSTSTKYIAQYLAEEKPRKAESVVARILEVSLLTSAATLLLLLLSVNWLTTSLEGTSSHVFFVLAVASFFTVLDVQTRGFLCGLQKMGELAAVSLAYSLLEKGLIITLLFAGYKLLSVVLGWLAALAASSTACLVLTSRSLGILGEPHPVRPLIRFSFPLYVSSLLAFGTNWIDKLFILPYGGQEALGVYHWTIAVAMVPSLLSTSVVTALFPKLSELRVRYGTEGLRGAFQTSTRYMGLIGLPMIVGLATLAHPIMTLLGGGFTEAAWPMIIICLAMCLSLLGVAVSPTFMALERTQTASLISVASILSSTAVCYVSLAHFHLGMYGAALGRVAASAMGLTVGVYALNKAFKVAFDKEALCKASFASLVMALAVMLSRYMLGPVVYCLYLLPFYVIVGAVVYFLSLLALKAVKKGDAELLYEYLPKKLKKLALWLNRLASVE